jgi:hypothetical protein
LDLEEDAVAAPWTVVDDRLARWFDDMFALVAGRFAQADSRRRARMYLLGLLSGAERKNSWTIAEQAGDLTPDGMQRLLNFYRWDAEAMRDDLRDQHRLDVKRTSLQRLARELDVDVETARAGLTTLLRGRDFTANRDPERTREHEVFEIAVDWERSAQSRISFQFADPPDHAR